MKPKCFIPLILIAMLVLTGCHTGGNFSDVTEITVPAIKGATTDIGQEAAAPGNDSATTVEAEEAVTATEPTLSGLPELEGNMHTTIAPAQKGGARLDWDSIPNAVSYEISRSFYPDHSFSPISTTEKRRYTNSKAPRGLPLYYQIRALDAYGNQLDTSSIMSIELQLSTWENKLLRYVAVPKIKLHTHPDSASPEVPLRYMDELQLGQAIITRDSGSWYRVYYQDTLYYLLIRPGTEVLTATKSQFLYNPQTPLQKDVIDLALDINNNWKTVYAYGGVGARNEDGAYEFCCSGMVAYILNNAMQKTVPTYHLTGGILGMTTTDVIYNAGLPGEFRPMEVPADQMRPGDVLYFRSQLDSESSTDLNHCSIYLGNNEFINCTSLWEDAVCIMPLTGDFEKNLLKVCRYLPETVTPANEIVQVTQACKIFEQSSSYSPVVQALAKGDQVTVLFTSSVWTYVQTPDNLYGFLKTEYIPTK